MVVTGSPIVYASSVMTSSMAPYALYQRKKIVEKGTVCELNDELGDRVDQLKEENDSLKDSLKSLQKSHSR